MIEASDGTMDSRNESPLSVTFPELKEGSGKRATREELIEVANEEPIIHYVNLVILEAIKEKASDIHFEPFEDEFRIRFRIDGVLYEMAPPPKHLALPVISRIKVLADLDIAEKRIPQDGHYMMTVDGRSVDLRVSTLPTQFGESLVLRVLDKSLVNLSLNQLGMPEEVLGNVRSLAVRPSGIFIITGPTGSGKTTTLYSVLREVNEQEKKILTAEDPVEYQIEGLMQVTINPLIDLTFARALRSFLRQDPDIIMVGEIRDLETASIAVQASFTGHFVLSTLHTIDSVGAITRLIDLGLEPYLVAASLESVLAQRLIRSICPECRKDYSPRPDLMRLLELGGDKFIDRNFTYGAGCLECNSTGYRGRTGLFEMLVLNDSLREMTGMNKSTKDLREHAKRMGLITLREEGIRAIINGITTVEEVLKAT